jgi:hypothetical protein
MSSKTIQTFAAVVTKILLVVLLSILCLTACAPAAARPPIQLQGTVKDMISATVGVCPTITTLGYNYLSIEAVGDGFVSCRASVTTGLAILGVLGRVLSPDQRLNVAFTSVSDQVVRVDISSSPRNTNVEDQLETALISQFATAYR